MKKKIFITLIVLILVTVVYAADVKWSALVELVTIADDDVLCVIDTGAGASKKITVLNFFDTIDTFAELNAITADKTLVNEEDAITWDSVITFSDAITLSDGATFDQPANNYYDFMENGDTFQLYFDGTDISVIYTDGELKFRNAEDGVDGIYTFHGYNAGEKGILRVLSDGDDKYIELHNDDTDAVITNSAGNIIINPVGLGIVVGDNGDEDYTLTFDGDTSDGILNYDEDNADFEFDQDIATTGDILVSGGNINTGAIALIVGDAATTSIQLLTDGTGDAEIALPNDAIGDAEINWATCTLADFDFETVWKMWHSDAAGDVTEITLGANGTFLESNGAAANPAFRALADGDVPDNITIDLATLATTVTVSDDEATNDDQEIVFTTDNTNLESDGDFHYSPDTGTVTATGFAGSGVTLASSSVTPLVDLNPAHTNTANIIDITPSAAISTTLADWTGIKIDGAALDPSDVDIDIHGVTLDLSGVSETNFPEIHGYRTIVPFGSDAMHIVEGKIHTNTILPNTTLSTFVGMDFDIDSSSLAASSTFYAIEVETTGTPAGSVTALVTQPQIDVIMQHTTTPATPSQTEYAGVKHTGGTVWVDGIDAYGVIFVADNDAIYVGGAAQFDDIEVIMTTGATNNINATIWYNTAADTWTEFFPADASDGFQQSGVITWELAGITAAWTANGDPGGADTTAGYWIKIVRTRNGTVGNPDPATIKIGTVIEYTWSKTGAIDVLSMEADTITEGGVAVYSDDEMDAFAEIDTIVADKSLVNLEDGGTFTGNIIANANLSVGNTTTTAGVLTLLEDDDDGANFASFMVPALGANTVYTLPPDDGDNTEVLQTNGGGTLTWVANAGGGATAWDDISDPDNAGLTTITFDNAETTLFTGDNDAAASFVTIQNTDGDHTAGNLYLLDLDYSADDGDGSADFIKFQDSGSVVMTIQQNGDITTDGGMTMSGTAEIATITEGLVGVPNLNETDWVDEDEMADSDHGDVQWAAGVAYVQAATLADTVYASCYVGLYQAATGNNEPFYTDGGLTYDATSGTLSSTVLTEGGNAVYNSTEVPAGSLGGTWANPTIDDLFILLGGDVATAGDYDFGSANVDLELPQTSPATPDVDGQVELDFTDGSVVIQHGSAHAELGASTDVVVGKLIRSFGGTIYEPDGMVDIITVKAINSIEFPHGIVVTAIYLGIASNDNYTLEFQNWDDFDTVNAGDPLIDSVAYTADASGEVIDTAPTYATIAAGQIIKISIPATNVDWINFSIYYYEPAG